ncbi:hypothetical protein SEA_SAKAI_86 [Arthrobacter phage Sakai]|nr:hypothetical protein SEA_GORPY_87 [Arthrobacter phage Gorpy]UVK62033.1 hypothetical protein SEA_SAKAI_86 [Arthrobacter phage Sakai]
MSGKRKPGGHPAKQDPDISKLFRTMKANVELVRDLEGKLAPDVHLNLRASALGMMHAYAAITGLPAPTEILKGTP